LRRIVLDAARTVVERANVVPGEVTPSCRCEVPGRVVADVLSDEGCLDAGLETTYPFGPDGRLVEPRRCQPIGQSAWGAGLGGVTFRSAALPGPDGEDLAWFDRPGSRLVPAGPPRPLQPARA